MRLQTRWWRALVLLVVTLVAVGAVTSACSGGGDSTATGGNESAVGESGGGGGGGGDSGGSEGGSAGEASGADDAAARGAVREGPPAGSEEAGGSVESVALAGVAPADRELVYRAEVGVRVADVARALREAERLTVAAGGYVSGEDANSSPEDRASSSGRITLKVPPGAYRPLLRQLGELGDQLSVNSAVEDVTDAVVDVEARIKAQSESVTRMRALLGQAKTVGEVVTVETELTRRLADLEALQARQKALADQVRYATVTASFYGPSSLPEEDETGFLAGLKAGWRAFTASVVALLTGIGAALPFLVLLAVLALPARSAWRALVRRRRTQPPEVVAP